MTDLTSTPNDHGVSGGVSRSSYDYDRPFFTEDIGTTMNIRTEPELPEELELRIDDVRVLRGFGDVASRQLRVLDNRESSNADILQALESDIHIACRLMRAAQSHPSCNGPVQNVQEAIRVIGHPTVRNIVMRAAMEPCFSPSDDVAALLWLHAAAVGTLARLLAFRQQDCDPQRAFTGGLLHDLGGFALHQSFPSRYRAVFNRAVTEGWNFEPLEEMAFGMNHTVLGAALAIRWRLDEALVAAIRLHHWLGKPGFLKVPPDVRTLVATVALADDLIHQNLTLEGGLNKAPVMVDTIAARMLPPLAAEIPDLWPELCRQYSEIKIMLFSQWRR